MAPYTLPHILLLIAIGFLASGINAVAGGGSLISFPLLTSPLFGLAPLAANTTNAFALWPGSLTGALGFRNRLPKGELYRLIAPSLLGSLVGAIVLLRTGNAVFKQVVPFLILAATVLLLVQPKIKAMAQSAERKPHPLAGVLIQFFISIYGGYFGAGLGIMMLGSFALTLDNDLHELNAIKGWLALMVNLVASAVFILRGAIVWIPALAILTGGLAGGYLAAHYSQRFDSERLRLVITVYGLLTAAYFFKQTFLR